MHVMRIAIGGRIISSILTQGTPYRTQDQWPIAPFVGVQTLKEVACEQKIREIETGVRHEGFDR